jgi:hypothetical protein
MLILSPAMFRAVAYIRSKKLASGCLSLAASAASKTLREGKADPEVKVVRVAQGRNKVKVGVPVIGDGDYSRCDSGHFLPVLGTKTRIDCAPRAGDTPIHVIEFSILSLRFQ